MRTSGFGPMLLAAAAAAALAGCGGGDGNVQVAANDAAGDAEGVPVMLTEAESAALADEAAADEAADMNLYGGNAAAGETGDAR